MSIFTQADLDAIPETGLFGARVEIRDGKPVRIPVLEDVGPFYVPEDEPMRVRDSDGNAWHIGYAADGKRYKRRSFV